jgi:activator of HSP90 ATPase
MPVTIKQKVRFQKPPATIYRYYTDPKLHGELIGGKVRVGTEAGAYFSAFGGSLKGKTLLAKKNRMFVQSWRSSEWAKEDGDSILVLLFRPVDGGTELELVHANVPELDAEAVKQGWKKYYWAPLRTKL